MLLTPLRSFRKRLLASSRRHARRRNFKHRLAVPAQVERLENRVMLSTLDTGEVQTVLSLANGNEPEGVEVDPGDGVVYMGNRVKRNEDGKLEDDNSEVVAKESIILEVDPDDGSHTEFAELPTVTGPKGDVPSGLLGLGTDPDGNLYAALVSEDPETHGVYRVGPGKSSERIAGSEAIGFPNAFTVDDAGNLYVTDSFAGKIWRLEPGEETFEVWVQNELLEPSDSDPFGFPIPGANGVAFFPDPDPHLNVANTEKGLVAEVAINEDGSAGPVDVLAQTGPFGSLGTIDGIRADVNGDIHGVIPGAAVLDTAPLVRVDAQTGTVTATVTEDEEAAKFDLALSLAFGVRDDDQQTVFVTNGDLGEVEPTGEDEPGPGLIQVGVGVEGFRVSGGDYETTSTESSTLLLDTTTSDEGSDDDGLTSPIDVTSWEPSDPGSAATGPTDTAIDDGSPLNESEPLGDPAEPTDSNADAVDDLFADLDGGLLDDLLPAGLSR